MKTARLYVVEGRVQAVGFRVFVEEVAVELGLKGYVCNRRDGSVEVHAEGAEKVLERLRSELEKGPSVSRVTRVAESPAPLRNYHTFSIEATR
jgi:acylphosphatase